MFVICFNMYVFKNWMFIKINLNVGVCFLDLYVIKIFNCNEKYQGVSFECYYVVICMYCREIFILSFFNDNVLQQKCKMKFN